MTYEPKVIEALARLRQIAADGAIGMFAGIARDLTTLDNAGVFAALDEQTDYASAEEILAEAAQKDVDRVLGDLDLAEWGDTTRADMARHQISGRLSVTDPDPAGHVDNPASSCVFGPQDRPYPHAH